MTATASTKAMTNTTDTTALRPEARDRLYAECANAISEAGSERESLFLARLALLLFEQVGDEARCRAAIADALHDLPVPSLSADAGPGGQG